MKGNDVLTSSLVSSFSIRCWQDSEGILEFREGQNLKYINVTIVDNSVPELDKMFRVELYKVEGGGENSAS